MVVSVFLFKNNIYSQNDVKYIKEYIQNNWESSNVSDCSNLEYIDFIYSEADWKFYCEESKPAYCREFFSNDDDGNVVYFNAPAVKVLRDYFDGVIESIPSKDEWETLQQKLYSLPNQPGCHLFSSKTRSNCGHSSKGMHRACSPDLNNSMSIPCSSGFVSMVNNEIVFNEGKIRYWSDCGSFYTEFNLKNGSMKVKNLVVEGYVDYSGFMILLSKH